MLQSVDDIANDIGGFFDDLFGGSDPDPTDIVVEEDPVGDIFDNIFGSDEDGEGLFDGLFDDFSELDLDIDVDAFTDAIGDALYADEINVIYDNMDIVDRLMICREEEKEKHETWLTSILPVYLLKLYFTYIVWKYYHEGRRFT